MHALAAIVLFAAFNAPALSLAQDASPPAKPGCAKALQPTTCKCTRPHYPSMAIRRHEQGVVMLKIYVSADSKVTEVELVKSSGSRILDNATLDHFKDVCFEAAVDPSGNPVASSATVEYVWRLE